MFASVAGNQGKESEFVPTQQSQQSFSKGPRATPYRVLLVDDDEATCQLLRDILDHYTDIKVVGQAGDGREAVAMATVHEPDVILMDVALPYLDGIEATHCIKKTRPRTVIIGLAGHFAPRTYNAMRTAGAAAFMCKNQALALHETIIYALGQWIE